MDIKSSVDWLIEHYTFADLTAESWEMIKQKAKEMHKEEQGKTWDAAIENMKARGGNDMRAWADFDEYYNKTYGGNNEH